MELNQRGFSLIEGLLIVIALTLIGGVGFYVVSANKDDKNEAPTSSERTQPTESKVVEKKVEYIEFKDLGFKIKKTDKMQDWSYLDDPQVPKTKYVQSADHVKKIDECNKGGDAYVQANDTPSSKSFVAFSRVDGTYKEGDIVGGAEVVKQFDSFFITIGYPNGGSPCFNEKGVGYPVMRSPEGAQETMKEALKTAEKI